MDLNEEVAQHVFVVGSVYTALIIIKTMFEAVGVRDFLKHITQLQ